MAERVTDLARPHPLPDPPPIPEPEDRPYPGTLRLRVNASDIGRAIFRVHETIPVTGPGELILVYPRWLPGFHAPQAPVELFAGLEIEADGRALVWRRHPVEINAFHVDVPAGVEAIEARFQFLSPTDPAQGRVLCSEAMLCLPWNTVLLHPAGFYARRTMMAPSLTLPAGWSLSCALPTAGQEGDTHHFPPVALDELVDSPVFAGAHLRRVALDPDVHLTLVGEHAEQIAATPAQIAPHRAVVEQADRLFGARHFDRFEMLMGLSGTLATAGVEHHRSFEAVTTPDYFTKWNENFPRRDTVAHEYLHSWNGKYRRGADSWQPCFQKPIRNSLMWVYEGLTQYWTHVLCARSGLWTAEQTLGALAWAASRYDVRPGSRWRPLIDTTRDPIIAARAPLPWPSWQRSEDYYVEGALIWLDVDTQLRALTNDARSLDNFARSFFGGGEPGSWATVTYRYDEVVRALTAIAPFDWDDLFERSLTERHDHAPLAGIERGGYRLAYRGTPTSYQEAYDAGEGQIDLTHSLGLIVTTAGAVEDVLWEGPAFAAGLTVGSTLTAVAGEAFTPDALLRALDEAGDIELMVERHGRVRPVTIASAGARFPYLERIAGAPPRLDAILSPVR